MAAFSLLSHSSMVHAVWRADQMASGQALVTASGFAHLDAELPHGGWPASALTELLLPQAGIGELQLLRPALAAVAARRGKPHHIALLQPPHLPHTAAWAAWGLPQASLLWIKTARAADALWSAEQILRNGSCGALLLWQPQVRSDALRRLHLAAQSAETLLWLLRPLAQAEQASPAPLRLGLRAAAGGIELTILKRRGPRRDLPLFVPLADMPRTFPVAIDHAPVDRLAPAAVTAGMLSTVLV
jgi:protein ImuA